MPYADRIVRIEDGRIFSDERPKKGAPLPPDPHHDHHDPHPAQAPAAQHAPEKSKSPAPPEPTAGGEKSLKGRFRIRRHA
jgi:putative ABC transport system ATP-binding protein